jgi:Ca2+-binding RTX toxin-like protein
MKLVPFLFAAVAVVACSAGDTDSSSEALSKGAGDGPPVWKVDPCSDPSLKANVHDNNGDHRFIGTDGDDVIFGTEGNDYIDGKGGNDIICARGGEDEIHGGDGHDYIDGGAGNDKIWGDGGNDLVHGRAGSDEIHGGEGDDILLGDILDDEMWGDDGDDLLIGGHGTDVMHGGNGNDYFRGDTGNDTFDGGPGNDVVSFMTAMPPVEGDPTHTQMAQGVTGVVVDMSDPCVNPNSGDTTHHDGCAYGDGQYEPLDSIEVVLGSPYIDKFQGGPNVKFIPADHGTPDPNKVFVYVDARERDLGVVVMGTKGNDTLTIHPTQSHDLEVEGSAGTKLATNASCNKVSDTKVVCNIQHTLRYVAAYGDDGDDTITFQGHFPRDFTAHASGGRGSDKIVGDDEQDVFFSGIDGEDWLYGNGGDDALLSESRPSFNHDKLTSNPAYTDGADHLFGGDGNDQLVADFPCGGHEFSGGPGIDIAGFARSGSLPIHAQLAQEGDNPSIKMPFYGKSYNPSGVAGYNGAYCTVAQGTTLHPDLEILEASSANDLLYGNDKDNIIWGREGDDEIHGLDGDDHLLGLSGNDHIYGEGGHDVIEGGQGFDHLYGADGVSDVMICGSDGGKVETMDSHDEVTGCKYK